MAVAFAVRPSLAHAHVSPHRSRLMTLQNLQLTKAAEGSCTATCEELNMKCSQSALGFTSLQDCKTLDAVFGYVRSGAKG